MLSINKEFALYMFSSPISIDCNSLNALKSNIVNDSELHDLAGMDSNGDDIDNIDKYEHEENPEGIVRLSIILLQFRYDVHYSI